MLFEGAQACEWLRGFALRRPYTEESLRAAQTWQFIMRVKLFTEENPLIRWPEDIRSFLETWPTLEELDRFECPEAYDGEETNEET